MKFMTCTIVEILCVGVQLRLSFLEKKEWIWEVFKETCFLLFEKKPIVNDSLHSINRHLLLYI